MKQIQIINKYNNKYKYLSNLMFRSYSQKANNNNIEQKASYKSLDKIQNLPEKSVNLEKLFTLENNAAQNFKPQDQTYDRNAEEESEKNSSQDKSRFKKLVPEFKKTITLGEILVGLVVGIGIYLWNDKNQRHSALKDELSTIKTAMADFLKLQGPFSAEEARHVKEKIMRPINNNWKEYIKGKAFDKMSASEDFKLDFLKLLIRWADSELIHHKDLLLVKEIVNLQSEVIGNCLKYDKFQELYPDFLQIQGRVLERNKKFDEAEKVFHLAKQEAAKVSSFTEITAERSSLLIQKKELEKEIKALKLKFNKKFVPLEEVTKAKAYELIKKCENIENSYIKLKDNNKNYVKSYLTDSDGVIKPAEDTLHHARCQEKILNLKVNKLILKLAIGIECGEDIKNIYAVMHECKNSLLLSKNNNKYDKSLHNTINDADTVLKTVAKNEYIKIQNTNTEEKFIDLAKEYNAQCSQYIRQSYSNAQFHCMQNKANPNQGNKELCEKMLKLLFSPSDLLSQYAIESYEVTSAGKTIDNESN